MAAKSKSAKPSASAKGKVAGKSAAAKTKTAGSVKKLAPAKPVAKKPAAKPVAKSTAVAKKSAAKKSAPVKVVAKKAVPPKPPAKQIAAKKTENTNKNKIIGNKSQLPSKDSTKAKPMTTSSNTKTVSAKSAPISRAPAVKVEAGSTIVPPDYRPTEKEEFMNPVMREYFRLKLLRWKAELLREADATVHDTLQSTELQKPDLVDRASAETDHALELRTRDRERKLISKIDEALLRIEDGSYGYCEETGEPISVARLDARPNATLSIEAQERHERKERTQRDD